ncbi:MAG TPA: hypothetical protein VMR18_00570 [Candidatus Saccharimonadales bacterium]|nr:hypothetical protein [Candidatus Saccharimonadales bacterium]
MASDFEVKPSDLLDLHIKPTSLLERMRSEGVDAFPGPDNRPNIAAEWMAKLIAPKVTRVIDELRNRPTGFNFTNSGDVSAFNDAVITGLQIVLEQTAIELNPYLSGEVIEELSRRVVSHPEALDAAVFVQDSDGKATLSQGNPS